MAEYVVHRWFFSNSQFTKRFLLIITSGLMIYTIGFITNTDTYARKVNEPVVNIKANDRGRCCISIDHSLDICGRPECLWQCPQFEAEFTPLAKDQKAFFHESSGAPALDFRQACAVESVALSNRNLTIYVLMSGEHIDFNSTTMETLKMYEHVHIHKINIGEYFSHTPLEKWYFCSTWNSGPYAVSHLSDALRFLTLYKYGGYYFDLDVIMLQSVMPYRNFIGAENKDNLAAGAFHVDYLHPVICMAVEEFRSTYRKDIWGHNGPLLLTRVMRKWCSAVYVRDMNTYACHGFQILPPEAFYPVEWFDWKRYFMEKDIMWGNETIGIHVWNKKSADTDVFKNSSQMYTKLARSRCSSIFAVAPNIF